MSYHLKTLRPVLVNPRTHWQKLRKNLNDSRVKAALETGMRSWVRFNQPPGTKYDVNRGPWSYSRSDYWFDKKPPKKNSPEYYHMHMGCHWLRGFECALGEITFPEWQWFIVEGTKHSTAVGLDVNTVHVLDFLQWNIYPRRAAYEILKLSGWPGKCELFTANQEVYQRKCDVRLSA